MTTTVTTQVFTLYNVAQKQLINNNWVSDNNIITNQANGWFGGGNTGSITSIVQGITYATDTATASLRGNLALAVELSGGVGNATNGWFGGGISSGTTSNVQGITFATDTALATMRGSLALGVYGTVATGNATNGWFSSGTPTSNTFTSAIQGIIFANDTVVASFRGTNITSYNSMVAGCGNAVMGCISSGLWSNVQVLIYANDTAATVNMGGLPVVNENATATGNQTNGWFAGGHTSANANTSQVQRIAYSTGTINGIVRGNLGYPIEYTGAVSNDANGWFGGGYNGAPYVNMVQKITYATDTATASFRGDLATATGYLTGV